MTGRRPRVSRTYVRWLVVSLALVVSALGHAVCHDPVPAHACLNAAEPIPACDEFLRFNPYDVDVRLSLCEAHKRNGSPLRALITLDKGLQFCGSDTASCERLRAAVAALEGDASLQAGSAQLRAAQEDQRLTCLSRARMPANRAIVACEEALVAFPNEAELHGAFGEKLIQGKQPARAVLAFRKALELEPGNPNFLSWHDRAETDRRYLAERCFLQTEVERCNQALLPGTQDEAQLHLHRSRLLLQGGNSAAAREAMLLVQMLQPQDRALSRELLQFLPAEQELRDAQLYLPRGRAYLTSGELDRAIEDLRRALEFQADRELALQELERARLLRAAVVQRDCLDSVDVERCQGLIMSGEPDEQKILAHIATIREAQARIQGGATAATPRLQVAVVDTPAITGEASAATSDSITSASSADSAAPRSAAEPAASSTVASAAAAKTSTRGLPLTATLRNSVSVDGVTH